MEGPAYRYAAVVRSVYDGDTVRVDLDLGCGVWLRNEPLRLLGIDAPELRGAEREKGIASRDALRSRLAVGAEVIVETVKDRREKYGRYLATVHDQGGSVNAWMLATGYAQPYEKSAAGI